MSLRGATPHLRGSDAAISGNNKRIYFLAIMFKNPRTSLLTRDCFVSCFVSLRNFLAMTYDCHYNDK